jgi:lysophospholipase L1-like esterase
MVPRPNTEDWAIERRELVLRRAREPRRALIVLVGDSISQGFDEVGRGAWRRYFERLAPVNLGCTGDRTEHVLWRLQQAPIDHLRPAWVVLLLGTNNLGHGTSTVAETLLGLQAVIALLRQQCPAAELHVCEVFPRNEPDSPLRRQVEQLNVELREWVAGQDRVRLHAFGSQFVGADGTISPDLMPDGLHLSAEGYERWAAALLSALTPSEPSASPR